MFREISSFFDADEALLYIRFYKLLKILAEKDLLTELEMEEIFKEPEVEKK